MINIFVSIKEEIYWRVLARALIALLPILIGFLWYGEILLFNVGLVTMSLFIVAERLKFGVYTITLHFLLIFVCFTMLFFAFLLPYLFVPLCAMLAFATIYFTQHGAQLRTLTNYTFIPAVYLACELHEGTTASMVLPTYCKFIALMPIAWLTIFVLYMLPKFFSQKHAIDNGAQQGKEILAFWRGILKNVELGKPESAWIEPALAIFFGVILASSFVITMHISRGEWVIWSTASVITSDFASSKKKLNERLLGVFIGAPLGFFVGQFVPKTETVYSLAVLAIVLTLVAFRRYRVGFGSRCFFIALASYVATATPFIALERIENVVIGGVIGIATGYISYRIFNRTHKT